ncbi:hypothetical protein ACPRSI_17010, partial [Enterobacter asburiae]
AFFIFFVKQEMAYGIMPSIVGSEKCLRNSAHREQRVMEALNAASRQQTTLMVTHQLEGIADWDQIWVMENGRIVEQGDYASLVAAQGPFAALLANRQEDI